MHTEILDNFLIPSTENWFGDNEVIFKDNNASFLRAKSFNVFLQDRGKRINDTASKKNEFKSDWKFIED